MRERFQKDVLHTEQKELESRVEDILTRGVYEVIDKDHLRERLLSGKKLRIKFGTDPTSPNIHLGRAVPLLKLRDFQQLGHQIVLIIGDFTGEVGDTSDKASGRPMLTTETVKENMKTYVEQCGKILDIEKTEIHYNSEWLRKLDFGDICKLADIFSIADFTSRKIIKSRLEKGKRVSTRELIYPLMQGYDSVAIRADVELGGNEQRYNLLAGREIQRHFGQEPQDILMTNLINGLDGRKMSSSWGNTINLYDSNIDMFGKLMSMVDSQIIEYYIHSTRVPMTEVEKMDKQLKEGAVNPRDIKLKLAYEITRFFHGEEGAKKAKNHFEKVIQKRGLPEKISEFKAGSHNIINILVESKLVKSRSEAKRLLNNKGVKINNVTVNSIDFKVPNNAILQKGKRTFIKIKF